MSTLPAIAYEFRFVALITVCIVALARLAYIAAERDLRGVYERLGIPWDDREAAELECGIRGDLGMPEPDPVVEFPLPEYGDDLAWQRLLMAVEADPFLEDLAALQRTEDEIRRLPEVRNR